MDLFSKRCGCGSVFKMVTLTSRETQCVACQRKVARAIDAEQQSRLGLVKLQQEQPASTSELEPSMLTHTRRRRALEDPYMPKGHMAYTDEFVIVPVGTPASVARQLCDRMDSMVPVRVPVFTSVLERAWVPRRQR